MPPKPRAAASRSTASGKIFSASHLAASGSMRSVANWRAVSRKACWSSVRLKSMRARSYRGVLASQRNGYAGAMDWRDMTEQEAATLPEARLGGALMGAVVAAALLFIVAVAGGLL